MSNTSTKRKKPSPTHRATPHTHWATLPLTAIPSYRKTPAILTLSHSPAHSAKSPFSPTTTKFSNRIPTANFTPRTPPPLLLPPKLRHPLHRKSARHPPAPTQPHAQHKKPFLTQHSPIPNRSPTANSTPRIPRYSLTAPQTPPPLAQKSTRNNPTRITPLLI